MSHPINPQQPGPYTPPPPPKKHTGRTVLIVLGVITVVLIAIIASCTSMINTAIENPTPAEVASQSSESSDPAKPATKAPAKKADPEPEPEPAPEGIGDGTYEVGVDIQPGRYKTTVPEDSIICSYQRLKDDSGDSDAIITIDVKESNAKASVTIKKSDGFFDTSGCGTWTKVS